MSTVKETNMIDAGMMDVDIACSGFNAEIFVIPADQRLPETPGVRVFLRQ